MLAAEWSPVPLLSLLTLGAFGTAIANVVMTNEVGRFGAARGSGSAFLMPVVALALGVVVRHEHVAVLAIIGVFGLLAGCLVDEAGQRFVMLAFARCESFLLYAGYDDLRLFRRKGHGLAAAIVPTLGLLELLLVIQTKCHVELHRFEERARVGATMSTTSGSPDAALTTLPTLVLNIIHHTLRSICAPTGCRLRVCDMEWDGSGSG